MNSTSYDPDGDIVNSTWLVDENKLYNSSIEMFKKLSLIFPKKSSYFAAQIEKIKNEVK